MATFAFKTNKMATTPVPQTIVDVRSVEEFSGYHVPGAINIPVDEVAGRINDFKGMKMPILVYCRSGMRSRAASLLLQKEQITDVIDGGGINEVIKKLEL